LKKIKKKRRVMTSQSNDVAGIYIHIPFCRKKCSYCDFYSEEIIDRELISQYVDKIIDELSNRWSELSGMTPESIYIGGGSPSILSPGDFEKICSFFMENKVLVKDPEFTVELNPMDVDDDIIKTLKNCGVNRISLGVQAYDDSVLNEMGRMSKKKDIDKAIDLITENFDNYSIDMIYGIGKNRDVTKELEHLFTVSFPTHLSAYSYTVPEKKNRPEPLNDDDNFKQEMEARNFLESKGLKRYEISNYSLPGRESVHNMIYWSYQTWLGIGSSAASFIRKKREHSFYPADIKSFVNERELSRYAPSLREQVEEFLLMGLRVVNGIRLDEFSYLFGKKFDEVFVSENIENLINSGFCVKSDDSFKCTEKGWLYLNFLLRELFNSIDGKNIDDR
jgi:oxygen-independent coproporphyrinogen III oxidase